MNFIRFVVGLIWTLDQSPHRPSVQQLSSLLPRLFASFPIQPIGWNKLLWKYCVWCLKESSNKQREEEKCQSHPFSILIRIHCLKNSKIYFPPSLLISRLILPQFRWQWQRWWACQCFDSIVCLCVCQFCAFSPLRSFVHSFTHSHKTSASFLYASLDFWFYF